MIFAGIGFGFHKAAKEQKRLEQGIAIKRMLYLLQGEIRYGFTPLPEAVLKISTKTEKEYQPFLKKVAKQLETHSEESFAKIWQQTADQKFLAHFLRRKCLTNIFIIFGLVQSMHLRDA